MVPSRMVGRMSQSSSNSGIFFQGDGLSQAAGNSQLSSTSGNPSHPLTGQPRASMVPVSGDLSNTVLNSVANSGPSVGESSLVTGSNSGISGGPNLQRSASINTESNTRLPASPMSFSSNNVSISGSAVIDGSSAMQQTSNQDKYSQHAQQNQGTSSVNSLPTPLMGQIQLPGGPRVASSFIQDPTAISHLRKKPCLDIKQEDIMQQQAVQQLLQRQDSPHLRNSNPQLQALIQHQRRQQEQQLLQSMSPMQRVQLLQQQQQQQLQLQLRQQLQAQGMQPGSGIKRPFDGGVCSRRLMQYLYHQRQRPAENAIAYWRKFVAEYYAPHAKKRWCLSRYDNAGQHSLGMFPQASLDSWQCDICGSKSGRGFEATFEVLPRLNEIKFGSGVIDELLFLDLPREYRFPSGTMVVEYAKAVQESVYEQLRVVREGQLRIMFTPELKISSWEFCARRHEELLPRRLVTPQVNQLLQVAQKCQSTISEIGKDGVPQQELQANSAMIVTAGRQLARSLELQSLNDLGFSKRYVRCLQIADVVNSMKDLIDFCKDQKVGPIDGLKTFPKRTSEPKPRMQQIDPTGTIQDLITDRNTLNKLMALHPGLNLSNNNNQLTGNRGTLSGPAALANYQNMLMRQNSINSAHHNPVIKQEPSSSNPPVGALSGSQIPSQMNHSMVSVSGLQQNQSFLPQEVSSSSQALQQQVIQQMLQDMSRKGNGVTFSSVQSDGFAFRNSPTTNGPGSNVVNQIPPSRSNSFKSVSNTESPASGVGYNGFNQKTTVVPQNLHSLDEINREHDISQFMDDGFFNSDLDDDMNFSWKV